MTQTSHIEFSPAPNDAVGISFLVPHYRGEPIYGELCNLCDPHRQLSMLHPDVLALLYHFGRYGEGNILELGPYVGGSTIALAWGTKERADFGRIISVELGGSYEHPTVGTDDIVRDLRENLEKYQVSSQVNLVTGDSRSPDVVKQVSAFARNNGFGLIFADTDGHIARDYALYKHIVRPGAYLIIDDYHAPGAPEKAEVTQHDVDALMSEGLVKCLGIYGWGTWVGRFRS